LLGKPDRQEALYWYKRGADHDNRQAATALAQLEKNMKLSAAEADKIVRGMHNDDAAQTPVQDAKPAPAKAAEAVTPETKTPAATDSDGPDAADVTAANNDDSPTALSQPVATATETPVTDSSHDNSVVAQIQEQLIKRGLFPGPADGTNSAQMNDAIRAYQSSNGLASDGRATQALLAHMLSSEIKSPAASDSQTSPKKTSSAAGTNGLNPGDMLTPAGGGASGPVSN
jgi:peptidoglycan hydrolase-like protein with peptidoglycan-binding domain